MKGSYLKIAEGYELIAAGFRELAEVKEISKKKAEPERIQEIVETPTKEEPPKVTIEDVRAVLAVKTRDGKTQKVKSLLSEFGADKLSSVPEDKLADLKVRAEGL
ncbi:hypothetical protein KM802_03460 [Clostridium tyrobutyricum]|nr:hypothetical protein [Clostridium tyrobutyricum]